MCQFNYKILDNEGNSFKYCILIFHNILKWIMKNDINIYLKIASRNTNKNNSNATRPHWLGLVSKLSYQFYIILIFNREVKNCPN